MCTDLWHQKFLVVSKPLWVCWSSEDREYASLRKYRNGRFFFADFLKRCREVLGRTSVGGNLGRTSVGGNLEMIAIFLGNFLKIRTEVLERTPVGGNLGRTSVG